MKWVDEIIAGQKIWGLTRAGTGTCIAVPDLDICFDVATGPFGILPINNFFLSHGHLDHAAGVPYIISQRALNGLKPPRFFMPKELVDPLTQILRLWEKIEDHQYEFEFVGMTAGQEVAYDKNHILRTFKTVHRIPSLGASVVRRRKKLKAEFTPLSREEIIAKKKSGVEIEEWREEVLVSFTGDTQIEFLHDAGAPLDSQLLFMEVTYYDDKKSVESARKWGHIHVDELIPLLQRLRCGHVVLIHPSTRYSAPEAKAWAQRKIPKEWWSRVSLLGQGPLG